MVTQFLQISLKKETHSPFSSVLTILFGVKDFMQDTLLLTVGISELTNTNIFLNKKVFLRERKRHTARRVASARYAGGQGVPHPVMVWGGTHPVMWDGVPPHHPDLGWGTPPPSRRGMGYPPPSDVGWGIPPQSDLGWDTPPTIRPGMGYSPPHRW